MPKSCLMFALSLTVVLSACSSAGGHAQCNDLATTQAYGAKWQEDLAAASKAGKVPVARVVSAQGRMLEQLGLLNEERFAEFCDNLDAVREEVGF
jgi:hypothetical protein